MLASVTSYRYGQARLCLYSGQNGETYNRWSKKDRVLINMENYLFSRHYGDVPSYRIASWQKVFESAHDRFRRCKMEDRVIGGKRLHLGDEAYSA